jgi:hypothetical protein
MPPRCSGSVAARRTWPKCYRKYLRDGQQRNGHHAHEKEVAEEKAAAGAALQARGVLQRAVVLETEAQEGRDGGGGGGGGGGVPCLANGETVYVEALEEGKEARQPERYAVVANGDGQVRGAAGFVAEKEQRFQLVIGREVAENVAIMQLRKGGAYADSRSKMFSLQRAMSCSVRQT